MNKSDRLKMWKIMGVFEFKGKRYDTPYARRIADILWHIYQENKSDKIFDYLINHGIVEKFFLDWFENECGSNVHVGIRKILSYETGEKRPNFLWEKKQH